MVFRDLPLRSARGLITPPGTQLQRQITYTSQLVPLLPDFVPTTQNSAFKKWMLDSNSRLHSAMLDKIASTWHHWGFRGPPLIYLVGSLAISDPHINIYVGPPNTCLALK